MPLYPQNSFVGVGVGQQLRRHEESTAPNTHGQYQAYFVWEAVTDPGLPLSVLGAASAKGVEGSVCVRVVVRVSATADRCRDRTAGVSSATLHSTARGARWVHRGKVAQTISTSTLTCNTRWGSGAAVGAFAPAPVLGLFLPA